MTPYTVRAISPTGERVEYITQAAHGCDAVAEALERGLNGVVARPVQERTEAEGYCRWPNPLHRDALSDAYWGWLDAQLTNEMEAV